METNYILRALLFIVVLISMVTDFRYRKIYNWVTYPAIALGLFLNSYFYGYSGFLSVLMSMGIGFIFMIIFYAMKQMGAGDVKLVVAMCAIENVFFIFGIMIVGTTLAAIYAVFKWIKTKNRRAMIPYGTFIGIGLILYQIAILYMPQ